VHRVVLHLGAPASEDRFVRPGNSRATLPTRPSTRSHPAVSKPASSRFVPALSRFFYPLLPATCKLPPEELRSLTSMIRIHLAVMHRSASLCIARLRHLRASRMLHRNVIQLLGDDPATPPSNSRVPMNDPAGGFGHPCLQPDECRLRLQVAITAPPVVFVPFLDSLKLFKSETCVSNVPKSNPRAIFHDYATRTAWV